MAQAWWREHRLRIYHPNARESELANLDVPRFVDDCIATQAEAIVVSAGGIYAFYPSQVTWHYISPAIGRHDLLGEITREAHARELRVIARVDFSKAREAVWQAHPAWFQRHAGGEVVRAGDYYRTCPLGGYQNEAVAHLVLCEILTRYGVDGFHLNAGGFDGYCYCEACTAAFGEPIPHADTPDSETWRRFLLWRAQAVGQQLARYHQVLRELNPDIFFMAELAGPQSPDWARSAGFRLPALMRAFSDFLITAGGVASARSSHWWVGLAADQARAVRLKRDPIINIKLQMRDAHLAQALMPPAEFAFYSYQALTHGAGLKLATFGIPGHQLDPRTMPVVTEVFRFMRQQQEVLDSMEPITPVALIWPECALVQRGDLDEIATGGLRGEFLGLYEALKAQHVLLGVLYDEQITAKRLARYEMVVLPTAVWLSVAQAEALAAYARGGGRLLLLDSPAASAEQNYRPMPRALAEWIGGTWTTEAGQSDYALLTAPPLPDPTPLMRAMDQTANGLGPLPLTQAYRKVIAPERAYVWLRNAAAVEIGVPEDLSQVQSGTDPLAFVVPTGDGLIVYVATGLGQVMLELGHGDYARILGAILTHSVATTPYLRTDAPSSVEVTLAHWKWGVVVHLVNAAGPAPLDAPAQVGPIALDLAWDGPAIAHLCVPGAEPQPLSCIESWNRVKIVVPCLGAYAQVVVRSG
jgi:hypothetical protein